MTNYRLGVGSDAEADIQDAEAWYRREANLGDAFIQEIELWISRISISPLRYPRLRRHPEVRRVLMDRFPYKIIYVRYGLELIVFRVVHTARHSREWTRRIPGPRQSWD